MSLDVSVCRCFQWIPKQTAGTTAKGPKQLVLVMPSPWLGARPDVSLSSPTCKSSSVCSGSVRSVKWSWLLGIKHLQGGPQGSKVWRWIIQDSNSTDLKHGVSQKSCNQINEILKTPVVKYLHDAFHQVVLYSAIPTSQAASASLCLPWPLGPHGSSRQAR